MRNYFCTYFILLCFFIQQILYAQTTQDTTLQTDDIATDNEQTKAQSQKQLPKSTSVFKELEEFVDDFLEDRNRRIATPKCQESWQREVCSGKIMCYATKCFYPEMNTKTLYNATLQNYIVYLQEVDSVKYEREIQHLQIIKNFGMPISNAKHTFDFTDTHNQTCSYWLWQKDANTLEVNLTGCMQNAEILYTYIEGNANNVNNANNIITSTTKKGGIQKGVNSNNMMNAEGMEEFYKVTMQNQITYLQNLDSSKYAQQLQHLEIISKFGLPKDYNKHEFIFTDENNHKCVYWLWKKDRKTLEINLTGCLDNAKVFYTYIADNASNTQTPTQAQSQTIQTHSSNNQYDTHNLKGVIEFYSHIAY